ncbi:MULTISPECIES: PrgI family protein [Actinomycetes]|uniref:PrgI family protein n=1 Tax=Actinomycetes TaxID=1760 RepID=UPI0015D5AB45|nr:MULTISPECIES: PrgI family protein [Actinomycetes]
MALEVKVYRDIRAYEAKVLFGCSWRQLAVVACALPVMALFTWLLWGTGANGYLLWPVLVPVVAVGWWRPRGLKPERFMPYVFERFVGKKVLVHESGDAQIEEERRRQRDSQRPDVAELEGRGLPARALGPSRPEPQRQPRGLRRSA